MPGNPLSRQHWNCSLTTEGRGCHAASTFASRGHDHSKSSSSRPKSVDSFKLSKFDGVPQRVDTHLHDQEVSFCSSRSSAWLMPAEACKHAVT